MADTVTIDVWYFPRFITVTENRGGTGRDRFFLFSGETNDNGTVKGRNKKLAGRDVGCTICGQEWTVKFNGTDFHGGTGR